MILVTIFYAIWQPFWYEVTEFQQLVSKLMCKIHEVNYDLELSYPFLIPNFYRYMSNT